MASNLKQEIKNAVHSAVGDLQVILHSVLVVVGLLILAQDLGLSPASLRLIPGSFPQWIYAAGFAYLIRR